jgi:hypothetical protein
VTPRRSSKQVGQSPRSRQTPAVSTDPFTFPWLVATAGHEWKTGAGAPSRLLLVERNVPGSRLKRYLLEDHPGLFRDFSALQGKADILDFANQFGTLFHGGYSGEDMAEGGTFGKDPTDTLFGTSLDKWKRAIADIRVHVRFWDSIMDCNVKELSRVIKWESDGSVGYRFPPGSEGGGWLWTPHFKSVNQFSFGDVLLPARYVLQRQINRHLAEPSIGLSVPALAWTPDLKQRIMITPPNLLAAMWLQFAQAVTGSYQLKRCPGCGKYFQAGRGGRRSDAETCSNTCRQRKARLIKGGTKTGGKN